jgi:hypothetical protein
MAPVIVGVLEWMALQKSAYLVQMMHVRGHAKVALYSILLPGQLHIGRLLPNSLLSSWLPPLRAKV